MRLRLGRTQVFLLADSTATLSDIPGGVAANLTYGTAGFSTSGAEPVEIRTSNGIVRSKGPDGSYGQVMIAGPHELIVTSFHGALDIDVDGQIQTVNDGQSYRVVVDDDPSAPDDRFRRRNQGHEEKRRRHSHSPASTGGVLPDHLWLRRTAWVLLLSPPQREPQRSVVICLGLSVVIH